MLAEEYAMWLARQNTSVARASLYEFFRLLERDFRSTDIESVLSEPIEYAAKKLLGKHLERGI